MTLTNNQSEVQKTLYVKQNQKAVSKTIKILKGGRNIR